MVITTTATVAAIDLATLAATTIATSATTTTIDSAAVAAVPTTQLSTTKTTTTPLTVKSIMGLYSKVRKYVFQKIQTKNLRRITLSHDLCIKNFLNSPTRGNQNLNGSQIKIQLKEK